MKSRPPPPPARRSAARRRGGGGGVCESARTPLEPVFVPPSVEEMNPLTFRCGPAVVTVTLTDITQFAPAASVPPKKEIELGAVLVRVPPQMEADPEVTVTPAGKVSET